MTGKFLKAILVLAVAAFFLDMALPFFLPRISRFKKQDPKKTIYMVYTEQRWKKLGIKRRISQRWVPFSHISNYLIKAVLIGEDDKFWHHDGFDFEGMEKALEKDMKAHKFKAGGSTITQQLAKNLFLTPSKNPIRKLKEAIYTWRLEKDLSKKRILEIYLNVAEWGDGIFGAEAASRYYFGKPASALTPEEAARLASVLPNPRVYSPVRPSRYVDNRSRIIYNIMVKRGIVEEMDKTVDEMRKEESPADMSNAPEDTYQAPPVTPAYPAPAPTEPSASPSSGPASSQRGEDRFRPESMNPAN